MKSLRQKFIKKIDSVSLDFVRESIIKFESGHRLIGLKGARGVGKTTLMFQYIKLNLPKLDEVLYVSLDDLYFTDNKLYDLADEFVKEGGKFLFLDEIHNYPDWSRELKNIYDDFPELIIRFTGSSILHINKGIADLSRRAVIHHLKGLSLREYMNFEYKKSFKSYKLEELLADHVNISREIIKQIKPIQVFKEYVQSGYYPFYKESLDLYYHKIAQVIQLIIEHDIPAQHEIQFSSILKLKRLLYVVAQSVPFKPNMVKLSEQVELSRNNATHFLHLLAEADLLNLVMTEGKGNSVLQKPDKIYLYHPNLMYALALDKVDSGNLRETFFINQLRPQYEVNEARNDADFMVQHKYIFEVGGKNKKEKQIKNLPNAFLALDDIEIGHKNTIPLWLLGFLT